MRPIRLACIQLTYHNKNITMLLSLLLLYCCVIYVIIFKHKLFLLKLFFSFYNNRLFIFYIFSSIYFVITIIFFRNFLSMPCLFSLFNHLFQLSMFEKAQARTLKASKPVIIIQFLFIKYIFISLYSKSCSIFHTFTFRQYFFTENNLFYLVYTFYHKHNFS